jgi:hypothetical protein
LKNPFAKNAEIRLINAYADAYTAVRQFSANAALEETLEQVADLPAA